MRGRGRERERESITFQVTDANVVSEISLQFNCIEKFFFSFLIKPFFFFFKLVMPFINRFKIQNAIMIVWLFFVNQDLLIYDWNGWSTLN